MVLNCVAEPEDRGEMLLRMAKMLRKETGVLFITIPRRCVENNPFCSTDIFNECLQACGLSIVLTKISPKIAFWVCEKKAKNVGNSFRGETSRRATLRLLSNSQRNKQSWSGQGRDDWRVPRVV
jgi:25S rRNA (adenine2142-N1)-methyltransferase